MKKIPFLQPHLLAVFFSNLTLTSNLELFFILFVSTEYRWYVTHSNDTENVEGMIRSKMSGKILYPDIQWEYIEVIKCYVHLFDWQTQNNEITNISCIFPWSYLNHKLYGCYQQVFYNVIFSLLKAFNVKYSVLRHKGR